MSPFVGHCYTEFDVTSAGNAIRLSGSQIRAFNPSLVETLINGTVSDWWGGVAFGGRRFLDLLPFFAIGFAALAEQVRAAVAWIVIAALAAGSMVLIANLICVIKIDADPGLRIVTGQLAAIGYLPRIFIHRSGGWVRLDVRAQIETNDGARIVLTSYGLPSINDVVQQALSAGAGTQYEDHYSRTTPRFETGDPRYAWLSETVFVAAGHLQPGLVVEYEVFRVT